MHEPTPPDSAVQAACASRGIHYELSSRAQRGICILQRTADPSLRSG